jgi:hypothetical protein
MTRISDIRPFGSTEQPQAITSIQTLGAQEDSGPASLLYLTDTDVLAAAVMESGPTGALAAKARKFSFGYFDPTEGERIQWTRERLEQAAEGIDPDLWEQLPDARTEFQLAALTSELRAKSERRRTLAEAGWGGAAANIGAQILDPISVGAMLATGGFGAAASAGRAGFFASRLGMATRAGLINAAPTAAGEAIRASEDPSISGFEIAANIASDAVFGGTVSALAGASRLTRFGVVGGATGLTAGTITAMDSDAEEGSVFAAFALSSLIPGAFAALPRAAGTTSPIDDALTEVGQRMVQRADVAIATAAGTPLTEKGLKVYGNVIGGKAAEAFDDTMGRLTGVYEMPAMQAERFGANNVALPRRARQVTPAPSPAEQVTAELFRPPAGLTDADTVSALLGDAATRGIRPSQTLDDGSIVFSGERDARAFVSSANASLLGSTSRFFQVQQLMGSDTWVVTRRSASDVVNDNIAAWKSGRDKIEIEIDEAYRQVNTERAIDRMQPVPLAEETPAATPSRRRRFWDRFMQITTENRMSVGGEAEPVVMKTIGDEAKALLDARRRGADAVGATPVVLNAFSRGFTDAAATAVIRRQYPSLSVTEASNMVRAVRATADVPVAGSPDFPAWSSQYRKAFGFADIGTPDVVTVQTGNFESFRVGSTSPGTAQQPGGNPLFLEKNVAAPIHLHSITDSPISRIPLPAFMRVGPLNSVDLGRLRFSNAAIVGRAEIPEVRLVGNMLNTDVVPKADGFAQYGAVSQVEDAQRAFVGRHELILSTRYDDYVKLARAEGVKPVSFEEFGQAAIKELRRFGQPAPATGTRSRVLMDTATEINKLYREVLAHAVAHNVPGAKGVLEGTKAKPYRVPRSYLRNVIDQDILDFKQRYGSNWRARLEEAWSEAVYRDLDLTAEQQADPARGKKLANLIAKRIIENGGTQKDLYGSVGGVGMSRDEFKRMVNEVFPDATPEEVAGLAARVLADQDTGPTPLRHRAPLDETYVHVFDDGTTYSIEDRLDSDPRRLFVSDASNLLGASGLAEMSRVWQLRTGREGFNSLDELLARVSEAYTENGMQPDADLQRIEWAAKKMLGIPTYEARNLSSQRAMALMQSNINAQYMRLLSTPTMGAVNATDIIRATAEFGHVGIMKQIPALADMISRAKKGDTNGLHLLAYMTQDLGIGNSAFTNGPIRAQADSNAQFDRLLAGLQNASARGAELGAILSGQKWTQDVGELIAAAGYIDTTVKMAAGDVMPNARQLRELGMDEAEWSKVSAQIKKHALRVEETGEVWYPNTQEWTDAEARANYDMAIKRNVRRAMNIADPTALPMWADAPWGKLLLQFRKFGMRAAETQLAYHLDSAARGDAAVAFSRMAISSFLGTLQAIIMGGFAVSTAALFGGDPNKVAEERFSTQNLALAGFGRATWSSLLPMVIDFGAASAGYKAPFSVNRISGLGADNGAVSILTGNPTLDWAKNAIGTAEIFRTPFDSELDFTSQHVRTGINALFLPNVFGVRDAINYIAKDALPERER